MWANRVYGRVGIRLRYLGALALAAALFCPVGALSQSDSDDDVVSLDSDIVTVEVTATDAKGDYVTDLKQNEIRLLEDGVPVDIDFFDASKQRGNTRPLAVVLALDTSGSITREEVELQRDSAMKFVGLVRPESLFAVMTFNHEVNVLQKFTNEAKTVGKAFDKVRDVGGSTRIYDALDQAVRMLTKAPQSRGGRRLRRVVVVITDGIDSASTIAPSELLRRASAAGVTFYSITIPTYIQALDGSRTRAMTLLDVTHLIPATGGADFAADSSDYTPIFRAIAEEISAEYQIAFYPPEAKRKDGKFHTLSVEVTRPGIKLRASRQGYQAPR
jgi:Ca-activated chloride channel family protein